MTEKVTINGNDLWIQVESHVNNEGEEYFTATYYPVYPGTSPGGILLVDADNKPQIFRSPVEALECCTEKLMGVSESHSH